MDQLYSEEEADTPSVFEYASSAFSDSSDSSDEDVDMLDLNTYAPYMPTRPSKRAVEDNLHSSSPEERQTKLLRMTSPSSSTTTSGPSSPMSPYEQSSRPFSSMETGFMLPNYYDDRSSLNSKRPAEVDAEDVIREGQTKQLKLNPLAEPFHPTSSSRPPTQIPTSFNPPCRQFNPYIGRRDTRHWSTFSHRNDPNACGENYKLESLACVSRRTTGRKPYDTKYSEGDSRGKRGKEKELSVEDMRRFLRRGGS